MRRFFILSISYPQRESRIIFLELIYHALKRRKCCDDSIFSTPLTFRWKFLFVLFIYITNIVFVRICKPEVVFFLNKISLLYFNLLNYTDNRKLSFLLKIQNVWFFFNSFIFKYSSFIHSYSNNIPMINIEHPYSTFFSSRPHSNFIVTFSSRPQHIYSKL